MNKKSQTRRFILTGTPGSGKTSVIKELEKLGHIVIHEAATDLIKIQQDNGEAQPWKKEAEFISKIALMQKERQINSIGDVQFFDRSPFCTYALARYLKHTPQSVLLDEIDRCLKNKIYQSKIFFFENLGFIENTNVRTINFQEALIFEQIHLDVYKEFGFDIMMAPRGLTVTHRCEFILEKV